MANYVEAKRLAVKAVKNNKDIYISLNPKARIHIYTKREAGNSLWYYAQSEIFKESSFEAYDTMSANTLEDLRNIVGILWLGLNRVSKDNDLDQ